MHRSREARMNRKNSTVERRPESPDSSGELALRRKAIQALDEGILRLVARRMEEAEAIARLKTECRIPLRNYEVEAQVGARLESLSEGLGRGKSLGRELAAFLIAHSLHTQSALLETAYEGDRLKVLVVGGMGGMGSWMAGFLNGQGHRVWIEDPAPGECPFPRAEPGDGRAGEVDLVVVAVPMSGCGAVLEGLWARRPAGVVAEMCSLKTHLLTLSKRLRREGMRLVSFHPMFGPGAAMLGGRKILLCTEGRKRDRELVRALFASTSAEIVEMTSREHDRRMALVLGMVHLSNLALARALSRSGRSFGDLQAVAGVTFAKQMATTREVVAENAALYYEIQELCAPLADAGRLLRNSLADFGADVSRGDRDSFGRRMRSARRYLR
jgi:prephenate dehydrogenase/chorismate mutase